MRVSYGRHVACKIISEIIAALQLELYIYIYVTADYLLFTTDFAVDLSTLMVQKFLYIYF